MHQANPKDLNFMNQLFEEGKVVAIIDRCYPLSETAEAIRYFGSGEAIGKVVVTIGNDGNS